MGQDVFCIFRNYNMKYKSIIVDDLPLAIASLKFELEEHFNDLVDVIETAEGVIDAAKKIKELSPDLIFLDIHMNDGDGFDLLDIIVRNNIQVIFTTASKDHAIKAFKYSASDYLLKPIDKEQLERAFDKLKERNLDDKLNNKNLIKRIALSTAEAVQLVEYDQISSLESSGNYTQFFFTDGSKLLMSKTLKEFESILDDRFLRVHQSHLVNIKQVKSYIKTEGGYIEMIDGRRIPVSVRRKSAVVEQLKAEN